MHKLLKLKRNTAYTDVEVVKELQACSRRAENWFFKTAQAYFDNHFREVFFDQDKRQEIFQNAFMILWTEIYNGKITVAEEQLVRQQKDGLFRPMTCSLSTFLMAIARNEHRELLRENKVILVPEFYDNKAMADDSVMPVNLEEDDETRKARIVDECLMGMSARCHEILTLFYYDGKSLDEILVLREENSSKVGLKTSKYKCINTLRERVLEQFRMYNLKV